jgi:hypothetical protein
MTPKDYLRPLIPRPDFFGLDRESQDALNGLRARMRGEGGPVTDAEFERMLHEKKPRTLDGLAWATYNQWVSEQRTQRRLKEEKDRA